MPITSSFLTTVILRSDISAGDWHLVDTPVMSSPDEGWDDWSGDYVTMRSGVEDIHDLLADFPIGMQLGSANLWVVGRKPIGIAAGIYKMTIQAKGLISPKGWKVRYTSFANSQTPKNPVEIPGVGTFNMASVSENEVGAEYTTVVIGSSPPTDGVGSAVASGPGLYPVPPDGTTFPAVKESFWETLPDPMYTYPNGWVFADMDSDSLISPEGQTLGVHLLRLRYKYVHPFSPQ